MLLNRPPVFHDGGHIAHSHGHLCRTVRLQLESTTERERGSGHRSPPAALLALQDIQRKRTFSPIRGAIQSRSHTGVTLPFYSKKFNFTSPRRGDLGVTPQWNSPPGGELQALLTQNSIFINQWKLSLLAHRTVPDFNRLM